MQLSLTIIDSRVKSGQSFATFTSGRTPEMETYERVEFGELDAPPRVLADVLRAVADDIDPRPAVDVVQHFTPEVSA